MTTDRYTRIVLTIIAAALVWLCVRDVLPVRVQARAGLQHVTLSDVTDRTPLSVKIVGISRTQWTEKTGVFNDAVTRSLPWEAIPVHGQ
jgi:hypothetical protein